MKPILVLLTGCALYWIPTMATVVTAPQAIPRPIIRVEQANARTLLQCTPQGMREYLFACKSRERMSKVTQRKPK